MHRQQVGYMATQVCGGLCGRLWYIGASAHSFLSRHALLVLLSILQMGTTLDAALTLANQHTQQAIGRMPF